MKKFVNKKGLVLEYTDKNDKIIKDKKSIDCDNNKEIDQDKDKNTSNYNDSLSCEIGKEVVIFKKHDIAVGKNGVKNITTGKFMSSIDSMQIDVKNI